jgi:hypothetical protein
VFVIALADEDRNETTRVLVCGLGYTIVRQGLTYFALDHARRDLTFANLSVEETNLEMRTLQLNLTMLFIVPQFYCILRRSVLNPPCPYALLLFCELCTVALISRRLPCSMYVM